MRFYIILIGLLFFGKIISAQNINSDLRLLADSAHVFCLDHQLDTSFCILINMGIHSGKNRLFVWDFRQQKVIRGGLCCHGIGKGSSAAVPYFSNEPNSYCTSLGKYKVGKRGYSRWGIHVNYRLHGLDYSNDNAFRRDVVLHSHTAVPERAIYPAHLQMGYSLGCPVVADAVMKDLDRLLQKATKPVLLWIVYQ